MADNPITVHPLSRYKNNPILIDEETGNYFFRPRRRLEIIRRDSDIFHTLIEEERLDALALKYYDSELLWWIIAEFNNIPFAHQLPDSGTVLRFPSRNWVELNIRN